MLPLFDTPKYNMQPATACAVLCPEKLESVNSILKSNLLKSKYRVDDIGTGIMKDSKSDHHELLINKPLLDIEEENDHLLRGPEDSISEDLNSEKISYSGLLLSGKMHLADNDTNTSLGKTRLNLQKFLEELKTFERGEGTMHYLYMSFKMDMCIERKKILLSSLCVFVIIFRRLLCGL